MTALLVLIGFFIATLILFIAFIISQYAFNISNFPLFACSLAVGLIVFYVILRLTLIAVFN